MKSCSSRRDGFGSAFLFYNVMDDKSGFIYFLRYKSAKHSFVGIARSEDDVKKNFDTPIEVKEYGRIYFDDVEEAFKTFHEEFGFLHIRGNWYELSIFTTKEMIRSKHKIWK